MTAVSGMIQLPDGKVEGENLSENFADFPFDVGWSVLGVGPKYQFYQLTLVHTHPIGHFFVGECDGAVIEAERN